MRIASMLALCAVLISCTSQPPTKALAPANAGDEAHASGHIEEPNVVELSADAQRRAGIEVENAQFTNMEEHINATGSVQAVDGRVAVLRPLARGRILQVLVSVGDRVNSNQVLARIDNIEAGELSSQVDAARAELQRTKIQLVNARRQSERAKNLLNAGAIPAKEQEAAEADMKALEEALRAQESLLTGLEIRLKRFGAPLAGDASLTAIRAPFSGVVTTVDAAPGDVVDSSSTLSSVSDLSRVYVEAQVYEKDLGRIRIGQPVRVTVDAFPEAIFAGRVVAIKDVLNPQTRTAAVRCELANPDGKLKLEMFASVVIPTTGTHRALAVPHEAVQTINRRTVVFVRRAELHFEVREVQVLGDGERVEIAAGLKAGEPVVVKGAFQLKSAFLSAELESEHGHD